MARPYSTVEHSPDKDLIDDLLDQGASLIDLERQFGFSRHALARRKASRATAAEAASPSRPVMGNEGSPAKRPQGAPASSPSVSPGSVPPGAHTAQKSPASPLPAETLQPVALEIDLERPAIEAPADADETAGNDAHLHRLRTVNLMRARGWSHKMIAQHFGKSISTAERWSRQARQDQRAALAKLDLSQEFGDLLWSNSFARSQHLANAERCLSEGDTDGHRRSMTEVVRCDATRASFLSRLVELGVIQPVKTVEAITAEDMVKQISSRWSAEILREIAAPDPEPTEPEEDTNV